MNIGKHLHGGANESGQIDLMILFDMASYWSHLMRLKKNAPAVDFPHARSSNSQKAMNKEEKWQKVE